MEKTFKELIAEARNNLGVLARGLGEDRVIINRLRGGPAFPARAHTKNFLEFINAREARVFDYSADIAAYRQRKYPHIPAAWWEAGDAQMASLQPVGAVK